MGRRQTDHGTGEVVGREAELAEVERLLSRGREGFSALLLEGEPGIGKTTVFREALRLSEQSGVRVLACGPGATEATLSLAAVADLLESVPEERRQELPPPQRRALDIALLLAEPDERPVEQRAVAAAVRSLVAGLAADGPLLLAVDDLQWLDPASAVILEYVVRRLKPEQVALLASRRLGEPARLDLGALVPADALQCVQLGPLSLGALQHLLAGRLGITLPRPILVRVHETSGGNPFFALELAGALRRRGGTLAPGEPLPIPSDLDELLRERLEGLGTAALDVARAVAALAGPTAALVEAAVGAGAGAGLDEALAARILELDGDRLRFSHPLLGSAVAAAHVPSSRRALHARLARVAPTAEEQARHLALATAEPDREIASILEEAAVSAHVRGAPATAAELAEQALRLTPPADAADARRRLFLAAERHDVAGDTERALSLLERARDEAPPGVERAAALVRLADVQDDPRASVPLYRWALAEAGGDPALEATIHIRLSRSMAWDEGAERGAAHAELAVRAASQTKDAEIRCRALAAHGDWQFRAGRGIPRAVMDEAVTLERSLAAWPIDRGPTDLLARQLVWALDVEPARGLLHELRDAHRTRSDADGEATATWWLALLEWRAGSWDEAERYAAESFDIRLQLGSVLPVDGFPVTVVAAHRGRVDEARAGAQRDVAEAEAQGIRIAVSASTWVLGFVELSQGDAAAALPHLRRSYELRNAFMLEPAQRLELGDFLEALVAVAELEEADQVLAAWDERAAALDRAWALAVLARGRGLLLAAGGDLEAAFESFGRALSEHARSADPFQHARTLLALGRTQRRAKRRGDARTSLEEALARFERLGAPLWAEQARAELPRVGGRGTAASGELTPSERRVVALAADGLSNKEIAATLFVTVHTVEVHLSHAYAKLGVRSRSQLRRALEG